VNRFDLPDLHLSTALGACRDVVSPTHKKKCEADTTTLVFLKHVLDIEHPDFVAFTGDQINGDTAPNAKSVSHNIGIV
jgi:predicted MPP superfamily phosphohydrolase